MLSNAFSMIIDTRWCLDELLKDGIIDQRDYNLVMTHNRKTLHPLQVIAGFHLVDKTTHMALSLDQLNRWLAQKAGVDYVRIDPLKTDVPSVTSIMSFEYARSQHILPVAVTQDTVEIGTDQPFYQDWQLNIAHIVSPKKIKTVLISPEQINRYRQEFYQVTKAIAGANHQQKRADADITNVEALLQLGNAANIENPDANDQHIVKIVDWLLQYAFDQRASDIHLEPRRDKSNVRFRIDGILHTVYQMPTGIMTAVVARIKILARLNVAEKRKPQDGRLKTRTPKGQETELRLSTLPTAFGEKLVMRVFDPEVLVRSFEQLGLTGRDLQKWDDMTRKANGIILVTGPTGSGKTTTLYSTLKKLATEEVNVCTIEDPIEFVHEHAGCIITQREVGIDTDSFEVALKNTLRQAPDVILIGEIRSRETMDYAIAFAETGHLCIATLHANNANQALDRILHLVPQEKHRQFLFDLSFNLRAIVAQQLLPSAHGLRRVAAWRWLPTAPFSMRRRRIPRATTARSTRASAMRSATALRRR